ncbi:MAG TPA: hypothetical protein VFH77_06690 [Streptomyces sp.]|nr:hypothetical protein [Streptomyces sp.]
MAGPWPFGETIVRLRRGDSPGRDPRGQPIPGPLTETEMPGCVVTPRQESPQVGGSEQQARDTVIVGYTVYCPSGSDVLTTDQFRIRGALFQVTGEPGEWGRNAFTGLDGPVQFAADRVTG